MQTVNSAEMLQFNNNVQYTEKSFPFLVAANVLKGVIKC